MTRLYLTRHGQTEWNLEGRMQGSKNSNLTSKGIEQAMQLGKWLEATHIDIVYSSSSGRALHTTELIVGDRNLPIVSLDELKEIHLGPWEGETFDVIKENFYEQYEAFWNTPHLLKDFPGETFENFKTRVVSAITKIVNENEGKDVLVVAHALVLKFILSYFENTPLEKLFDDRIIQSTSLSVVELNDNKYEIIKYGDTEHYNIKIS